MCHLTEMKHNTIYPGIQFRLPSPPPQDNFSWVPNCSLGNEGVLKKNLVWAMSNCMVSMPTNSEFEKGVCL